MDINSDNISTHLPPSVFLPSKTLLPRLLSFKKRGSDIKCTSEPRDDGRYTLTASIIEQHEEIMHIELIADNRIELEKMKYNFRDNPEICYKGILALMSGEVNYLLQ